MITHLDDDVAADGHCRYTSNCSGPLHLVTMSNKRCNGPTSLLLCCTLPVHLTPDPFLLPHIESVIGCGPGSKIRPVYQVLSSLQRLSDRNFAVFSFHRLRIKKKVTLLVFALQILPVRPFVTLKWRFRPESGILTLFLLYPEMHLFKKDCRMMFSMQS